MAVTYILVILALALVYGCLNGLHGSASIVSTMISSRALGPRQALLLAALGISAGPFVLGVAVASTIGAELIRVDDSTAHLVIAGLMGAILWSAITFWLKIPSSISQALIGALMGAVLVASQHLMISGLQKTLSGLFLSPILGILVAFILVRLAYRLSASATPHVNLWFNRGQILVSLLMAVAFGANDGQKIMGVITLGLVATGFVSAFDVPLWVVGFAAGAIGIGTLMGGWRLIHTLGGKFYKIRPIHGFGAQLASGLVMLSAALVGGPVSGSQVVTSAIVGAGSADRIQKVRWGVVQQILAGWLLTLPFSGLIGALVYLTIEKVML
jgi:PiT family inorganic phosphate transporter